MLGHGDVAEEEAGDEGARAGEAVGRGVDGFGFVAVDFEDEVESVGYQVVIVDDQNTLFHETPRAELRGGNPVVSREVGRLIEGLSVMSMYRC